MDDLKLCGKNERQLMSLINTVHILKKKKKKKKNGIHFMQTWKATMRHEVTRKRSTKRLKHTGYV